MKHLEVISSEIKTDKNNREYNLVGLSTPSKVNGLMMPVRTTAIIAYKENYLSTDKKKVQDFGWDAKAGNKLAGDLITRACEMYEIEGVDKDGNSKITEAQSATVFVAGNTDDPGFEVLVLRAFANRGFILDGADASSEEEVAEPAGELTA